MAGEGSPEYRGRAVRLSHPKTETRLREELLHHDLWAQRGPVGLLHFWSYLRMRLSFDRLTKLVENGFRAETIVKRLGDLRELSLEMSRATLNDELRAFFDIEYPEKKYQDCLEAGVVERESRTRNQSVRIPPPPVYDVFSKGETIPMAAMRQLVRACWGWTSRPKAKEVVGELEEAGAVEDLGNGKVEIVDDERFGEFLPPLAEWSAYQEIGEELHSDPRLRRAGEPWLGRGP